MSGMKLYSGQLCPHCQIGILTEMATGDLICPSGECGHAFGREGNCLTASKE